MTKCIKIEHRFVKSFPDKLEEGVLYVSIDYASVAHNCLCGCGNEVITPLSPTDWSLTFNGESVSLTPSIGNWSFPCQSHYWIEDDAVRWAAKWSKEKIEAGRALDRRLKQRQFGSDVTQEPSQQGESRERRIMKVWKWVQTVWSRNREPKN